MIHADLKGHSGVYISLGENGGAVHAQSVKQKLLTLSSAECELVAVHDGIMKALFVQNILREINSTEGPIQLFQDNQATNDATPDSWK
jgi:hypothetical protein